MKIKQTVQLVKNMLSDGSETYDVEIRETSENQDEVNMTAILISPPRQKDAEEVIEVLVRLGGLERIEHTKERHY